MSTTVLDFDSRELLVGTAFYQGDDGEIYHYLFK